MRIIPCLSVWNEMWPVEGRPMLARCLEGLAAGGMDHAIVVDGRYYRDGANDSLPWPSTDGTLECVQGFGDFVTLVPCPEGGWPGQEIKRTQYLRAADRICEPGDWLLQVDGDEELVADLPNHEGRDLREWLEGLPESKTTVYVAMQTIFRGAWSDWQMYAKLYRWVPGLYYGNEHWDLHEPSGARTWGLCVGPGSARAATWPHLRFRHWTYLRPQERIVQKSDYEQHRGEYRRVHGSMNPNPGPAEYGLEAIPEEVWEMGKSSDRTAKAREAAAAKRQAEKAAKEVEEQAKREAEQATENQDGDQKSEPQATEKAAPKLLGIRAVGTERSVGGVQMPLGEIVYVGAPGSPLQVEDGRRVAGPEEIERYLRDWPFDYAEVYEGEE